MSGDRRRDDSTGPKGGRLEPRPDGVRDSVPHPPRPFRWQRSTSPSRGLQINGTFHRACGHGEPVPHPSWPPEGRRGGSMWVSAGQWTSRSGLTRRPQGEEDGRCRGGASRCRVSDVLVVFYVVQKLRAISLRRTKGMAGRHGGRSGFVQRKRRTLVSGRVPARFLFLCYPPHTRPPGSLRFRCRTSVRAPRARPPPPCFTLTSVGCSVRPEASGS